MFTSPTDGAPPFKAGMRVHSLGEGSGRWEVRDGDTVISSYVWDEMRFSISWKAYCFADESEREVWRSGSDDLSVDAVLEKLEADLRSRGRITGDVPAKKELALILVDEYIDFPPPVQLSEVG